MEVNLKKYENVINMSDISTKVSIKEISAAKFVALIGAFLMICEGILYILRAPSSASPALYIITGIINLAGGTIVFLLTEVTGLEVPIPYKWWLLLAIAGGVLTMEIITRLVVTGGATIFGIPWYLG